jgi:hypothetical protein
MKVNSELTAGLARVSVRDSGDEFRQALSYLRDALAQHPSATAAALNALARQGRDYATTEEGAQLVSRLQRSELVRRAGLVWHASAAWGLELAEGDYLPTELLEAVMGSASRDDMENILASLVEE